MRSWVVALAVLALPSAAWAQSPTCPDVAVARYLEQVPYFATSMRRTFGDDDSVRFRHVDDPRISVAFTTRTLDPSPVSRSDFIKALERDLDRRVSVSARPGVEVARGIFPFDPVAWSIQETVRQGDNASFSGELVIRVRPDCGLVATWRVLETPILTSRVVAVTGALDGIRQAVGRANSPSGFLPDRRLPSGASAAAFGILLPLAAALGMLLTAYRSVRASRPGPVPRGACVGIAVACLVAGLVAAPEIATGLAERRFVEDAASLSLLLVVSCLAAASGLRVAILAALCYAACVGLANGLTSVMGWAPDTVVSGVLSAVLLAFVAVALTSWNAGRRRVPTPSRRVGRPA